MHANDPSILTEPTPNVRLLCPFSSLIKHLLIHIVDTYTILHWMCYFWLDYQTIRCDFVRMCHSCSQNTRREKEMSKRNEFKVRPSKRNENQNENIQKQRYRCCLDCCGVQPISISKMIFANKTKNSKQFGERRKIDICTCLGNGSFGDRWCCSHCDCLNSDNERVWDFFFVHQPTQGGTFTRVILVVMYTYSCVGVCVCVFVCKGAAWNRYNLEQKWSERVSSDWIVNVPS